MITIVLIVATLPAVIYIFLVWNFGYWRKRGVTCPPTKPLLGTFPSLFTQKQHFAYDIDDVYRKYKDTDSYVGVFLMRSPQLMVLDPQLVHQVFVTAFKHFHDNDASKLVDGKKDALVANNPFLLAGETWKEQRALVSPGLTGSRIKVAYTVMQNVCRGLCEYIERESKLAPSGGLNGKDLALRFTSENICDCVLGIKAESFTSHPLPVATYVKMFTENNTIFFIYTLMVGIWPGVIRFYKAKFFPPACDVFFLDLMKRAFSIRRTQDVDRQDFMNHLLTIEAKRNLKFVELASHSMTFMIDGLDTTATAISHCLLLLARNEEAQHKLRLEIMANLSEDGQLTFEKLNELPYLDACIHESLRIFSPGLFSSKYCTEPYEFQNKKGQKLRIEKGETILIPLHSIHQDPNYYPQPEKFMPERFMPENGGVKKYTDMGVYLGFGDGPRKCLGMRFALVQTKAAISVIVRHFNIKVNPKTKAENRLDPKAFLALQDGGVWLDFETRINTT